MRKTLLLTLGALAVALAVCALSLSAVNAATDEALRLQSLAVLAADDGETDRARTLMVRLAEHWREKAPLLETVASHDALHDVSAALAEARICLECDDHDDFLRTMSTVELSLNHLKDEQAVKWENLY